MRPIPKRHLMLCAALLIAPAAADDAPFLGTDPASVAAEGDSYILQWLNWGTGHSGESYNAFQTVAELDYGLTDRLQLAASLVYDWSRTRPPGAPAQYQSLPGLALEAIYILLPTDKSPVGVALAVDPALNAQSRGIALRLLLQKYVWGLEHVLNINFENDWEKDGTGRWTPGSGITFNYGVGYALDGGWTVAIEFGNEFQFDELLTNGVLRAEANTFYFGPTIQYDCKMGVVTLGAQMQLPLSTGNNVVHGYTVDAERFRLGMRFTKAV